MLRGVGARRFVVARPGWRAHWRIFCSIVSVDSTTSPWYYMYYIHVVVEWARQCMHGHCGFFLFRVATQSTPELSNSYSRDLRDKHMYERSKENYSPKFCAFYKIECKYVLFIMVCK